MSGDTTKVSERERLFNKYRENKRIKTSDKKKMFNKDHFQIICHSQAEESIYNFNLELVNKYIKKRYTSKLKILDVGCGCGYFLKACKQYSIGELYGVDISPFAINHCKNNVEADVTELDIENDNFPYDSGSFDLVCFKNVLEHVRNQEVIIKEITRVLKINGELLILTINGDRAAQWLNNYYGNPLYGYFEIYELKTRKEIERLLHPVFNIEVVQTTDGLIHDLVHSTWINQNLKNFLISLDAEIGLGINLMLIGRKNG
ncbi:MAG: class I SAM-dependent methyltransferase [bacterium]